MTQSTPNLTESVLDFLLSQPTPEQVIALHPSPESQARLRALLNGNRNGTLTDAERADLETYIQLDNFVSLLKARVKVHTGRNAGEASSHPYSHSPRN